jgi:hypothetical protein
LILPFNLNHYRLFVWREKQPEGLERNAVAYAWITPALHNDSELMPPPRVIDERMHAHAVKQSSQRPTLLEGYVQAADDS